MIASRLTGQARLTAPEMITPKYTSQQAISIGIR